MGAKSGRCIACPTAKTPKEGDFPTPPDFAVEVISPNDVFEAVEDKSNDYEQAGVPPVWVIGPKVKAAQIRYADGTCTVLQPTEVSSGQAVVPGFSTPVMELFGWAWSLGEWHGVSVPVPAERIQNRRPHFAASTVNPRIGFPSASTKRAHALKSCPLFVTFSTRVFLPLARVSFSKLF